MLATRLTEMLNVRYPIMLAGMAGVSLAEVVAAVSEAGGYGVLGAGNMSPDEITDELARVRSLTDKPFGVDLLHAINDNPVEEVKRIIDGGATSFAAGLGVPKRVMGMCHEAGLKVITVTATVKHARMAAEAGCDLIVAQGSEAGGHTGSVGAFALLPQAVDAVPIPVVAAGGILRRSRPGGGPRLRLRGRLDRHAVCRLARGPSGAGLQERDCEGERK